MPELPEVESVRRSLEPHLLGRRISAVTLHRRDVLIAPGDPTGGFSRQRSSIPPRRVGAAELLVGATIEQILRRGKQLAVFARSSPAAPTRILVVQLGMSGQFLYRAPGQRLDEADHVHAVWRIETRDGTGRLVFRDPRRFGQLRAFPDPDSLETHWHSLGPDALTIQPDALTTPLAGSTRAIKAALLDQSLLAGVGNIYADESLFSAGIRPDRPAGSLSSRELERLAHAIRGILSSAVAAGGSTLRDYTDADGRSGGYQTAHRVYARAGRPCTVCATTLSVAWLGQRTTVWCPRCQL